MKEVFKEVQERMDDPKKRKNEMKVRVYRAFNVTDIPEEGLYIVP